MDLRYGARGGGRGRAAASSATPKSSSWSRRKATDKAPTTPARLPSVLVRISTGRGASRNSTRATLSAKSGRAPTEPPRTMQLRIHRCDDCRGRKPGQPRRLLDHARGQRIARLRSLEDLPDRIDVGTAGLPVSPHDTGGAHLILEAALQARLGLQRIATDRQIADLTGGAVLAANELAIDIESQSDAGTEREEGHVGNVLRAAMPYLPEQREIDVIFDGDGTAEFLTQQTHDIEISQAAMLGAISMAPLLGFTTPGVASTMERIRLGCVWLSRARRPASRAIWSSAQAPPRLSVGSSASARTLPAMSARATVNRAPRSMPST